MPRAKDLAEYGLDADEIEEIQSAFDAKPRNSGGPVSTEVERLVTAFDCSAVAIGIVRFDSGVVPTQGGVRFGFCEADPLVVDHERKIWMLHHDSPEVAPMACAESSEQFLDALLFAAEAIVNRVKWKGRGLEIVHQCSERAGSATCRDFFRSVVGGL
ncbi:hypothetical protein Pla52n_24520 [Stieleria varia]|uniref:Uncharacterized protein n=2 Tax=Stieleria varia TaxID=2528005 RepID=A0A5C6AZ59_9BACT|nr:hypothetical protein Pla52n_24520 [Stieleria varia]